MCIERLVKEYNVTVMRKMAAIRLTTMLSELKLAVIIAMHCFKYRYEFCHFAPQYFNSIAKCNI